MANKTPEEIFHQYGGQLKMSDAIKHGITRYMLYSLRDKGIVEQISRGLYRLTNLPPLGNQDLVAVSLRAPNAVICLVSSLSYHELTTQIPHVISIALPRGAHIPLIDYPPTQVHRFSDVAYQSGIEEHMIDGVSIKFIVRENNLMQKILKYAKICRVERAITPYLEAII